MNRRWWQRYPLAAALGGVLLLGAVAEGTLVLLAGASGPAGFDALPASSSAPPASPVGPSGSGGSAGTGSTSTAQRPVPEHQPELPGGSTAHGKPTPTPTPAPTSTPSASDPAPVEEQPTQPATTAPPVATKPTSAAPNTTTVTSLASVFAIVNYRQKTSARCPTGWRAVSGSGQVVSAASRGDAYQVAAYPGAASTGDDNVWYVEWLVPAKPTGARSIRTSAVCQRR